MAVEHSNEPHTAIASVLGFAKGKLFLQVTPNIVEQNNLNARVSPCKGCPFNGEMKVVDDLTFVSCLEGVMTVAGERTRRIGKGIKQVACCKIDPIDVVIQSGEEFRKQLE